jgi:hypothetical protein
MLINKEGVKANTREEGGSPREGMLDTTRTCYSKYVVVTSIAVLAAALQYLMFYMPGPHGNVIVSCVSFFFFFGISSFQFCLLVSNFGCFMYISCKSCQCFHLYLLPNTDIHWFGISEHLIVEKMERQMSGNDYKFRITVYGCGLLPLIYIETLLQ